MSEESKESKEPEHWGNCTCEIETEMDENGHCLVCHKHATITNASKPKTQKTKDDFYMEDVSDLAIKAFDVIEQGLKEYGITLNDEQDDAIYVPIRDMIEKHCINDYRNYN